MIETSDFLIIGGGIAGTGAAAGPAAWTRLAESAAFLPWSFAVGLIPSMIVSAGRVFSDAPFCKT